MTTEINLEYGDVLKAYQSKANDLLVQLITAEARLNASASFIKKLEEKIIQLEDELHKIQKTSNKIKKPLPDTVVDYNS